MNLSPSRNITSLDTAIKSTVSYDDSVQKNSFRFQHINLINNELVIAIEQVKRQNEDMINQNQLLKRRERINQEEIINLKESILQEKENCKRKQRIWLSSKNNLEQQISLLKQQAQRRERKSHKLEQKIKTHQQKQNKYLYPSENLHPHLDSLEIVLMEKEQNIQILQSQLQKLKKKINICQSQNRQLQNNLNSKINLLDTLRESSIKQRQFFEGQISHLQSEILFFTQQKKKYDINQRKNSQNENFQFKKMIEQLKIQVNKKQQKILTHQRKGDRFQDQIEQLYSKLSLAQQDRDSYKEQIVWYESIVEEMKMNFISKELQRQKIGQKNKKYKSNSTYSKNSFLGNETPQNISKTPINQKKELSKSTLDQSQIKIPTTSKYQCTPFQLYPSTNKYSKQPSQLNRKISKK